MEPPRFDPPDGAWPDLFSTGRALDRLAGNLTEQRATVAKVETNLFRHWRDDDNATETGAFLGELGSRLTQQSARVTAIGLALTKVGLALRDAEDACYRLSDEAELTHRQAVAKADDSAGDPRPPGRIYDDLTAGSYSLLAQRHKGILDTYDAEVRSAAAEIDAALAQPGSGVEDRAAPLPDDPSSEFT